VVDAARATTAAPTYFTAKCIFDGKEDKYFMYVLFTHIPLSFAFQADQIAMVASVITIQCFI